ncbi:MAG: hypothetical protein WKF58_18350 [Ilumatobacteraceae bacterium]
MQQQLELEIGEDVPLAEAAFNRPNELVGVNGEVVWPIGFQFAHGEPPAIDNRAFFLLRDMQGNYTQLQTIDNADPDRVLIVARDMVAFPFSNEQGVIYAAGYNKSASNETADRGTAWVERGQPSTAI